MDQQQLERLALQVRWQHNGIYRRKSLCQACLMEKGAISTPEDQQAFEQVWHQWWNILKRDRCVVCGELKETMLLPAH
jgi:hypothetical protein